MKTLVIFDSLYGNTEKVARAAGQAIAEACGSAQDVRVVKPAAATPELLREAELVVVGAPTHGFKPFKDMQAFLAGLSAGSLKGKQAAAFDTRADVKQINNKILTLFTSMMGYAAEDIHKALKKKGADLAGEPAGFFIEGKEGPLRDGELERAAAWARALAA